MFPTSLACNKPNPLIHGRTHVNSLSSIDSLAQSPDLLGQDSHLGFNQESRSRPPKHGLSGAKIVSPATSYRAPTALKHATLSAHRCNRDLTDPLSQSCVRLRRLKKAENAHTFLVSFRQGFAFQKTEPLPFLISWLRWHWRNRHGCFHREHSRRAASTCPDCLTDRNVGSHHPAFSEAGGGVCDGCSLTRL